MAGSHLFHLANLIISAMQTTNVSFSRAFQPYRVMIPSVKREETIGTTVLLTARFPSRHVKTVQGLTVEQHISVQAQKPTVPSFGSFGYVSRSHSAP